jgi:CheY-like chemotaxis protein
LRALRKKNIQVPVVAQTAYALANEVIAMKEAGFKFYITKPIKTNDLFSCLSSVLKPDMLK